MTLSVRTTLLLSSSASLLLGLGGAAMSQTTAPAGGGSTALPKIEVIEPRRAQPPRRPRTRVTTGQRRETPAAPPPPTEAQVVAGKNDKFDEVRQNIVAPIGATSYQINHQAIEALPQGSNASLDKVLLQFPGVTQDSSASGELHVRNEHANIQYRINGIMLPDGVGAFGQILDTGIVGSLALLTGALPAQYGLRTAGVLDIQTKADAFNNSGSVSVYGGSHGTITTSLEYGGTVGQTQYFMSGRYFGSNLGIENPTPANEAIHDRTSQEKAFLYLSTVIDPTSRLTFMSGVSNGTYQIPNRPGQSPAFTAFGVSTTSFPISTATASCTSCLTPSVIWFSTVWLRTSTARAMSMAFRRIPPGASASPIRFGSAFRRARSALWSPIYPPCCQSIPQPAIKSIP